MEFKGLSLKDILDKNWSRKAEMLLISVTGLVLVTYVTKGAPQWVTAIGQIGCVILGVAAIGAQWHVDSKHGPRDKDASKTQTVSVEPPFSVPS